MEPVGGPGTAARAAIIGRVTVTALGGLGCHQGRPIQEELEEAFVGTGVVAPEGLSLIQARETR